MVNKQKMSKRYQGSCFTDQGTCFADEQSYDYVHQGTCFADEQKLSGNLLRRSGNLLNEVVQQSCFAHWLTTSFARLQIDHPQAELVG